MADLVKPDRALLKNVSTGLDVSSPALLSKEDSCHLIAMMEELTRRYPSQDHESSIAAYFKDYEKLASKCGMRRVQKAVEALRIMPGRAFFPRPDEVAEEIEHQREKGIMAAMVKEGKQFDRQYKAWADMYMSPEEVAWRKEKGYE